MENSLSKSYTEVLLILSYMEQKYIDMIPKKLLELFNEEKDKNYQPNINPNISLAEQNLQKKTLALLAMLNLNYWCVDENEKKELLKMYSENDKKLETEMRERYNPDNLFKKKEKVEQNDEAKEESTEIIEYKEQNIFKKILNRIMKFFKKNNYYKRKWWI